MSLKKAIFVDLENLLLDHKNPRLDLKGNETQEKIIQIMYEAEAVDEIAHSIAKNGYFSEECLVVIKDKSNYIVLEGNRRLTALKLLTNRRLVSKINASEIPEITEAQKKELLKIPVVVYADRDAVMPNLGFRHITGIKTWEPFQKARYIYQLVESGKNFEQIIESIGDSAGTTKKMYEAFTIYKELTENHHFKKEEIKDSFSLIGVALGQSSIRKLIGIKKESDTTITVAKPEELKEVMSFIFGHKKSGQTKLISDSRQISSRLNPICSNEESYEYLTQNRDLEGAYEKSDGEKQFVLKHLIKAYENIAKASMYYRLHSKESDIKMAREKVLEIIKNLNS
jgi:hypothetical protein